MLTVLEGEPGRARGYKPPLTDCLGPCAHIHSLTLQAWRGFMAQSPFPDEWTSGMLCLCLEPGWCRSGVGGEVSVLSLVVWAVFFF